MMVYSVHHMWVSHRNGGYEHDYEDAEKKAQELHDEWCRDKCFVAYNENEVDEDYVTSHIPHHECKN